MTPHYSEGVISQPKAFDVQSSQDKKYQLSYKMTMKDPNKEQYVEAMNREMEFM